MRFGKKLALHVMEDQSGAPYLSHKLMKEAINQTVRELRLYQTRLATTKQPWQDSSGGYLLPPDDTTDVATLGELTKLEENIIALDKQLFSLVDDDIDKILKCVRLGEECLSAQLRALQNLAMEAGLLVEESKLELLERNLPYMQNDRKTLSGQILELRFREDPVGAAQHLEHIKLGFNILVDMANQHAQYLEINVAGFRKLLKRHEKQIPANFHSRPMPCLGYHHLVTHTSRQFFELVRQFHAIFIDARQKLVAIIKSPGGCRLHVPEEVSRFWEQHIELHEVKGFGPECEMVVNIQKQLKDPMNTQSIPLASTLDGPTPTPGYYSKPGVPMGGLSLQSTEAKDLIHNTVLLGSGPKATGSPGIYVAGDFVVGQINQQSSMYPYTEMSAQCHMKPDLAWCVKTGIPERDHDSVDGGMDVWRIG